MEPNYFYMSIGSMILNIIALFCLFQPNIVRALHFHHLDWRKNIRVNTKLEESIWQLFIRHLSLCKDEDMDKHYMTCSKGSFTRREYLKEFEKRTPVAQEMVHDLFLLAEDMMQRQVKTSKKRLEEARQKELLTISKDI